MKEEALKHLEDRCLDETEIRARDEAIDELIQEVRRLHGLIKSREWILVNWKSRCVFCNVDKDLSPGGQHATGCPAFEPNGEVR